MAIDFSSKEIRILTHQTWTYNIIGYMIQAWSDTELKLHHNCPSQTPSNEIVVVFKLLFKGVDKKELNKPTGGFQFTHTPDSQHTSYM